MTRQEQRVAAFLTALLQSVKDSGATMTIGVGESAAILRPEDIPEGARIEVLLTQPVVPAPECPAVAAQMGARGRMGCTLLAGHEGAHKWAPLATKGKEG